MQQETNNLSRRSCQWLRTSTETKIIDTMHEVESLGADEDLTEAIIALEKAFNRVANYTDKCIKQLGNNHEVADVKHYNLTDLISFGNYLLSDTRRQLVADLRAETYGANLPDANEVTDADLANWK